MRICTVCSKHIAVSETLVCSKCKLLFHCACVNITKDYLRAHVQDIEKSWTCPECLNLTRQTRSTTRKDDTPNRSSTPNHSQTSIDEEEQFHTPEEDVRHLPCPLPQPAQRCRRQLPFTTSEAQISLPFIDAATPTPRLDILPVATTSNINPQHTANRNDIQNSDKSNVSLENLVKCDQCSQARFFKGNRGLKIHCSKVHRLESNSTQMQLTTSQICIEFWRKISNFKNNLPIVKRIPRGARISVAKCLIHDLKKVILSNSLQAWEHLLTFPYRILHVPKNPLDQNSLTNKIKQNCQQYSNSCPVFSFPLHTLATPKCSVSYKLVEDKMAEGDIRGSARLLFSNDTMAPNTPATLLALKEKHPSSPAYDHNLLPPSDPSEEDSLSANSDDVSSALASFPSGSAGGIDSLTPQHLKDLTGASCGETGDALLKELTLLVNVMLGGKVNSNIIDILYGANMCALLKKDGGIRPIAVGTVYRRLAAKIGCQSVRESLCKEFQPVQLGFGSRGGCEAAVHALRTFLTHQGGEVLVKVDVKNAFNSVDRSIILNQVKDKIPHLYNFILQCYGKPSKLIYKNNLILSEVGCQQGDPLGPALFSLAIHPIIKKLESKFNVWYLDDGTLGGDINTVHKDLNLIITEFDAIGLTLNFSKCEIYIPNVPSISQNYVFNLFKQTAPNIKLVENRSLRLLGSPILDESISDFVDEKIQNFNSVSDRLEKINTHVAYFIIRYCLFVPKFTYILRCCQLWNYPMLIQQLDNIQRNTLTAILNTSFDDRAWRQASLPIRFGGLGIRKISSVSLPAFLSSAYSTQKLVHIILSPSLPNFQLTFLVKATESWKIACPDESLPKAPASQRQWDSPLCSLEYDDLLDTSFSSAERARLLAVARWESGLWLHALPSRNFGNLLDNNTFRLAVCLRIGTSCQVPHRCFCEEMVDRLGHHGLSCIKSAGRIPRHASLNDIIRRAFVSAGVPSVLEPNGLIRDDGKRPDGMTLVPWKMGRPLVWDATCVDTMAPSHLPFTSLQAGAAAVKAENLKRHKYALLDRAYMFVPFGVETMGSWGPAALGLFKDLAKRLVEASGDQNAGFYLAQKISIAIQRGNAASVLGTFPSTNHLLF